MAAFRTRSCVLAVKLCLWLTILSYTTDCVGAQLPKVNPDDSSTIIWGELPPVPMATNMTSPGSRPSTLAAMAEGFVDLVQPKGLPLDYIQFALETVYNETSYYEDNWQTEMWKIMGLFVGIIVCVLFGILYFIILPFVGFIFSCCRCCDRCGGKRVQRESKHMGCSRVTLTLFFFCFTGIICAGMAFTNVSNEFLKTSVTVFKDTADNTLGDMESYLGAVNEQIEYMVDTEYGYVDTLLTENLEEIGDEIGGPVGDYLLDEGGLQQVLDSITNISSTFSEMERALNEIESLRSELINQSTILESELNQVATNLDAINQECSTCISDIDKLVVNVNYTKLPSVETQIDGVEEASMLATNITVEINTVLADIPSQITDMTSNEVQDALVQLDAAEKEVTDAFDGINKTISDFVGTLSDAKGQLDDSWEDVTVYSQYMYYALIGVTCTILLIIMFNLIGLTMGTFSYKDVHPMERSRMSNAGGNVLMAGVFFTFVFAPLLMFITCVAFFVMSLGTLTCEPLLTYDLLRVTIDQPNVITEGYYLGGVVLDNSSIPLTASGILTECSEGSTVFTAFKFDAMYDFDSIKQKLDELQTEFDNITDKIDPKDLNYDFPFAEFADDLNKLRDTTELGSINQTQYDTLLDADITGLNLTEYANKLQGIAEDPGTPVSVVANITAEAEAIRNIQDSTVEPMQANTNQIQIQLDALMALEEQLDAQINQTIDAIGIAELASNSTADAVLNISEEYAERLLGYGYQFYYQIEYQVKNDFAECQIISSLYAYSIQSTCDYPIASLNTFWFTVGWCVFFYVPSIIVAVKLAKYYRIMDEEAPYRAPKKSKKKKKQERRESDEEMPMDDMDHGTGPDNIRLVDNGRPTSMMPQQNPHYVPDEPILAYNDLGRPMAPPPAYNPGPSKIARNKLAVFKEMLKDQEDNAYAGPSTSTAGGASRNGVLFGTFGDRQMSFEEGEWYQFQNTSNMASALQRSISSRQPSFEDRNPWCRQQSSIDRGWLWGRQQAIGRDKMWVL
ncbi:prominin-1-A isoform X3 [Strongylocentrotus purpuratus]|uniref:Prominin-like protein n=1 Tax=Strongylocentrotus purpuratus TaxID=7668 RepID=A0A7M7NVF5_STRPU|nr:prominin-1-A isoform X3 [Strongylocentrotus purpuratus]